MARIISLNVSKTAIRDGECVDVSWESNVPESIFLTIEDGYGTTRIDILVIWLTRLLMYSLTNGRSFLISSCLAMILVTNAVNLSVSVLSIASFSLINASFPNLSCAAAVMYTDAVLLIS